MRLSEEQKKIVADRLVSKLQGLACDVCAGSNGWSINDTIFELREFHHGKLLLGGPGAVYPAVTAACKNCGNTKLFSAIILGLLEGTKEEKRGGE